MRKELNIVLGFLLLLTLSTFIIYNCELTTKLKNGMIFILSYLKMVLIAFYFMDLKNAHLFWKLSFIGLIGFIFLVINIL
jgi:uncharacterized membrane protein